MHSAKVLHSRDRLEDKRFTGIYHVKNNDLFRGDAGQYQGKYLSDEKP